MESIQEQIGNNIKEFRLKKGYTQSDLAQKLNVTKVTISRLENGKRSLGLDKIINLCEILETNIYYIFKNTAIAGNIDDIQELTSKIETLPPPYLSLVKMIVNQLNRLQINEDEAHKRANIINSSYSKSHSKKF